MNHCNANAPLFKKTIGICMYARFSTYAEKAEKLQLNSPYEFDILTNADFVIKMRKSAKIGTIIGSVASAASSIFSYDPTIFLVVTSVSAIAWFGSHKLVQTLEPKAQRMIQELKGRPPSNTTNATEIKINSRREFQKSKGELLKKMIS